VIKVKQVLQDHLEIKDILEATVIKDLQVVRAVMGSVDLQALWVV